MNSVVSGKKSENKPKRWLEDSKALAAASLFNSNSQQPIEHAASCLEMLAGGYVENNSDKAPLLALLNQEVEQTSAFTGIWQQALAWEQQIRALQSESVEDMNDPRLQALSSTIAKQIESLEPGQQTLIFEGCDDRSSLCKKLIEYQIIPSSFATYADPDDMEKSISSYIQAQTEEVGGLVNICLSPGVASAVKRVATEGVTRTLSTNMPTLFKLLTPGFLRGFIADIADAIEDDYKQEWLESMGVTDAEQQQQIRRLICQVVSGEIEKVISEQFSESLQSMYAQIEGGIKSTLNKVINLLPSLARSVLQLISDNFFNPPHVEFWFEVTKQEDGLYQLAVYGGDNATMLCSSQAGGYQSPLIYNNLSAEQLDTHFIHRALSYRVWPYWNKDYAYNVLDVKNNLLATLGQPTTNESTERVFPSSLGALGAYCYDKFGLDKQWWHQLEARALVSAADEADDTLMVRAGEHFSRQAAALYQQKVLSIEELKTAVATQWDIKQRFHGTTSSPFGGLIAKASSFLAAFRLSENTRSLLITILVEHFGEPLRDILDEALPQAAIQDEPNQNPFTLSSVGRMILYSLSIGYIGVVAETLSSVAHRFLRIASQTYKNSSLKDGWLLRAVYPVFRTISFALTNLQQAVVAIAIPLSMRYLIPGFITKALMSVRQAVNNLCLRLAVKAFVYSFLSYEQRRYIRQHIYQYSQQLTRSGSLDYQLSMQEDPLVETNLQPWIEALESSHNHEHVENVNIEKITRINQKFSALPVPTQAHDSWDECEDPLAEMERITADMMALFNLHEDVDNLTIKKYSIMSIMKGFTILDKLARRCPEAHLSSHKNTGSSLAALINNPYLTFTDRQYAEDLAAMGDYFGLDTDKIYTNKELGALRKNCLFDPWPPGSCCDYGYDSLNNGLKNYFDDLLEYDKTERLKDLKHISRDEAHDALFCDEAGTCEGENNPRNSYLPRAFYLLRLAYHMSTRAICGDLSFESDLTAKKESTKPPRQYDVNNLQIEKSHHNRVGYKCNYYPMYYNFEFRFQYEQAATENYMRCQGEIREAIQNPIATIAGLFQHQTRLLTQAEVVDEKLTKIYGVSKTFTPEELRLLKMTRVTVSDQLFRAFSYLSRRPERILISNVLESFALIIMRFDQVPAPGPEREELVEAARTFFLNALETLRTSENSHAKQRLLYLATRFAIRAESDELLADLKPIINECRHDVKLSLESLALMNKDLTGNNTETRESLMTLIRARIRSADKGYVDLYEDAVAVYYRHTAAVKQALLDESFKQDVLNQIIADKFQQPKQDRKWTGQYPIYRYNNTTINLATGVIHRPLSAESKLQELASIFSNVTDIVQKDIGLYYLSGAHVFLEFDEQSQQASYYKIFNNHKYQLIRPSFQSINELDLANAHWWYCAETQQLLIKDHSKILIHCDVDYDEANDTYRFDLRQRSETKEVKLSAIDTPNLSLLAWFCPENEMKVYKRAGEDQVSQIHLYNLIFDVEPVKGELQAVSRNALHGYYIAKKQKRPYLNALDQYLLLENEQGHETVIIRDDTFSNTLKNCLINYSGATLLKSPMLQQFFSDRVEENTFYYIDIKDGKLSAKDAHSSLMLMLYYLSIDDKEQARENLKRFEEYARRDELSDKTISLLNIIDLLSTVDSSDFIQEVNLRLDAAVAENQLIQVETSTDVSSQKRLVQYLRQQMRFQEYLNHVATGGYAFLDETQELFLIKHFARLGKLILSTASSDVYSTISQFVGHVGLDAFCERALLLPDIAKRFELLSQKYQSDHEVLDSLPGKMAKLFLGSSNSETTNAQGQADASSQPDAPSQLTETLYKYGTDPIIVERLRRVYDSYNNSSHSNTVLIELLVKTDLTADPLSVPTANLEANPDQLLRYFFQYYQLLSGEVENANDKVAELKRCLALQKPPRRPEEKFLWYVLLNISQRMTGVSFPPGSELISEFKAKANLCRTIWLTSEHIPKDQLENFIAAIDGEYTPSEEEIRTYIHLFNISRLKEFFDPLKQVCIKNSALNAAYDNFNIKNVVSNGLTRTLLKKGFAYFTGLSPLLNAFNILNYAKSVGTRWLSDDEVEKANIESKHDLKQMLSADFADALTLADDAYAATTTTCLTRYFDCQKNEKTTNRLFDKPGFESLDQSIKDFDARDPGYRYSLKSNNPEDLLPLEQSLQQAQADLQQRLSIEQNELLDFINQEEDVYCAETDLINAAYQRTRTKPRCQWEDALQLYLHDDPKRWQQQTNLSQEQIQAFKKNMMHHLCAATEMHRQSRALKLIAALKNILTPEPSLETQVLITQLGEELAAKRQYNFAETPEILQRIFLVFEYTKKVRLWERTVRQFTGKVTSELKSVVAQCIMGSGKTWADTPMTDFLCADGQQIVFNIWPEAIANTQIVQVSDTAHQTFGQQATRLKINRSRELTSDHLWAIVRLFKRAQVNGEQINLTREDAQSLELKFIETLYQYFNDKKIDKNEYYKRIAYYKEALYLMRKYGRANIEEAHDNFNRIKELNYPLGEKKKINPVYNQVLRDCMRIVVNDPVIASLLPIKDNTQYLLDLNDPSAYKEQVIPHLARTVCTLPLLKDIEDKETLIDYLSGNTKHIPEFIKQHPNFSDIALVKGFITRLLYVSAKRIVGVDCGSPDSMSELNACVRDKLSDLQNPDAFAVPFAGNESPDLGSQIRSQYEAAVKTMMVKLHQHLYRYQIAQGITLLRQEAIKEKNETGREIDQTQAGIFFRRIAQMDLPSTLTEDVIEQLKDNDEFLYFVNTAIINAKITYYPMNLNANSQNLYSQFNAAYGSTGTPSNAKTYPLGVEVLYDKGTQGESIDIMRKIIGDLEPLYLENENPRLVLDEIIDERFNGDDRHDTLIDTGALCRGISNFDVAKRILERTKFRAVCFYNENKELMFIERDASSARPYAECNVPFEERATYHDDIHTFASDIKKGLFAKAVFTVSEQNFLSGIEQGIWRMRDLKRGMQGLTAVALKRMKPLLEATGEQGVDQSIAYTHTKEQDHDNEQHYLSELEKLANLKRDLIMRKMIFADSVDACIESAEHLHMELIEQSEDDPAKLWGQGEDEIESSKVIDASKQAQSTWLDAQNQFTEDEKQSVKAEHKKIGRDVNYGKVKVYMDEGKLDLDHQDYLEQNQQIQVDMYNEQDAENELQDETNNQRETKQNTQLNSFWYKAPSVWEWPKMLDLTGRDWLNPSTATLATAGVSGYLSGETCSIYQFSDVVKLSQQDDIRAIADTFSRNILCTNNFIPLRRKWYGETYGDAGAMFQKPVQSVLVIKQGADLKLLVLDQHDEKYWQKKLADDKENGDPNNPIQYGLYDINMKCVKQSGANRLTSKAINASYVFRRSIAQLKFFCGHVKYDADEQRILKPWIKKHGLSKMQAANQAVLANHEVSPLKSSDLEEVFYDVAEVPAEFRFNF